MKSSREKILETATKLFAKKGFDGVSVREICKEAEVNVCMISYYFGGKQELYQAIIDDMVARQGEYAKTFLDFSKKPNEMGKKEQIALLKLMLDKFIDFFYTNVSNDLLTFLIKEQQSGIAKVKPPHLDYFRSLIAAIFDKDENDKEIIYKSLFIIAQINSPRIFPLFSLRLLGQDEFFQEDIKIIKDNLKTYLDALLKEVKID